MHDVRAVRDDPAGYVAAWTSRGVADAAAQVEAIVADDVRLRAAKTRFEQAQAERNAKSKLIGAAKARGDEAQATALMAEVESLKGTLAEAEAEQKAVDAALNERLAALPNLAAPDVPEGADEHGNVEQKRWGDPHALPAGRLNAPKDHVALGEALGMMDFEAAARMSGARFVVLKRDLARLERALGQFMLDLQTGEHEYTEISPPLLVRDEAFFGTGQMPKFEGESFSTRVPLDLGRVSLRSEQLQTDELLQYENNDWLDEFTVILLRGDKREVDTFHSALNRRFAREADERAQSAWKRASDAEAQTTRRWLIPTAEVSLTNLVREQITPEAELPMRLTALTPCFRSEAGSHGRDTRGMIRQHQFIKCELVSITTPEQAADEHERMTTCAEAVLERLGLPYRRMLLCTGDMGFAARRTYDLEVWLPSQDTYREISSCSDCGDFQARRMDARFKRAKPAQGKPEKGAPLVHTLNGSGLAVGRTLVALMENYQDEGGRIALPEPLRPYMGGATHIGGEG